MEPQVRILFTQGSEIEIEVRDLTGMQPNPCGTLKATGELDENNAYIDLNDEQAQSLAQALYVAGYTV